VTHLAREDFRVFEDGEPVEIDYFSEVGGQATAPSAAEPPAASPDPGAGASTARETSKLVRSPTCARRSPPEATVRIG
jgi:hypothetical protein